MADQKISQLSEATTLQNADVFAVAVDLATAPVTKKITLANLINLINKPAGSSGQVQFNNAGAFGGDNGLFWDNTNKRLGIGTTGPGYKLDVQGGDLNIAAGQYIRLGQAALFYHDVTGQTGTLTIGSGNQINMTFYAGAADRMYIQASTGNVGIGTTGPTAKFDIDSDILRLRTAKTPASAGAAGNAGDICWDADYVYLCIATNTWRRIAHATW
jgi:hypothetical protein